MGTERWGREGLAELVDNSTTVAGIPENIAGPYCYLVLSVRLKRNGATIDFELFPIEAVKDFADVRFVADRKGERADFAKNGIDQWGIYFEIDFGSDSVDTIDPVEGASLVLCGAFANH